MVAEILFARLPAVTAIFILVALAGRRATTDYRRIPPVARSGATGSRGGCPRRTGPR